MPHVLIKADDLRLGPLSQRWKAFLDYCAEREYHANVGVMGGWTHTGGDDDDAKPDEAREMLGWLLERPTLHIWNHGFTHFGDRAAGRSEFLGPSVMEQARTIRKTQDRIEELCGVRLDAFGAPFNWTDHHTVEALQHFDEIRYAFYTPFVPGKVTFHHELFVTCEPFEGEVKPGAARRFDLEKALSKSRHFREIDRSFVLQIHPNRWVEGSLEDFGTFIETLASEGYRTATVEDFAKQGMFAGPDQKPRPLPHKANRPAPAPAAPPAARGSRARVAWRKLPEPVRRAVPDAVRQRLRARR